MSIDTSHIETAVTVEALLAEQSGETTAAQVPEPPCGALFASRGVVRMFALVAAALDDGSGYIGRDLIDALVDVGYSVSPGTAYPVLHDLHDEGLLDVREFVRSKRYHVADEAAVRGRLAEYEARLRWLADCAAEARAELE